MGTGTPITPSRYVLAAACRLGAMSMCLGELGFLQSWLGGADGNLSKGTPDDRMAPKGLSCVMGDSLQWHSLNWTSLMVGPPLMEALHWIPC